MNNVELYVFSGTGNTLLTANFMKEAFTAHSVPCKLHQISQMTKSDEINLTHTIGIGFPIVCFNTYPLVLDFINKLPKTECCTDLFFFSTMGGSDGHVCAQLTPIFESKGYNVIGYEGFILPSNFMQYKVNEDKNERLFNICKKRSNEFIEKLINNKEPFKYKGKIASKFYNLIYKLSVNTGFLQKTFPVKVNIEKCTGCSVCAKVCPVNNISIIDHKAVLADKCQDCMRCVGFCPENAIRVHKSKPYSSCSYSEFFSIFDQ